METIVRVHRILKPLESFEILTSESEVASRKSNEFPRLPIGVYKNPGRDGVAVYIYDDGLSWVDAGNQYEIKYDEIASVELLDGKGSSHLVFELMNGNSAGMPILGSRENFHDSLEVLRFLDRVLADRRSET